MVFVVNMVYTEAEDTVELSFPLQYMWYIDLVYGLMLKMVTTSIFVLETFEILTLALICFKTIFIICLMIIVVVTRSSDKTHKMANG